MLTDGDGESTPKPTDSTTRRAALTKTDLIEEVFRVVEIPRTEAVFIVECILNSIVRAIHCGDKVEIRGFGSFRTRQRGARIGRNPKTGVRVDVPAKIIPFFKPARNFGNWWTAHGRQQNKTALLGAPEWGEALPPTHQL